MSNLKLAKNINTSALCDFIKKCTEHGTNLRSFECVKGGETLAAVSIAPYRPDDDMLVYSLSKSFTSVCVGIAQEEGLLNINERIIDIFPKKCPRNISENLAKMRLKDCLCMTSGHEVCVFEPLSHSEDPVAFFLSQPVVYEPGKTFVYSTAATYICGAVVSERSGKSLLDYLYEKVLSKMDIEKPFWERCDDGSCMGGTGLHISCETAVKFAKMLLAGGVYEGKQIVPKSWLEVATSVHSLAPQNGTPDWIAGYGYQFWMNSKAGFRGDGAYGQLCMVFPEWDMIFCCLCDSVNMQKEVDMIYELICDGNLEKNDDSRLQELQELSGSLYTPQKTLAFNKKVVYSADENIADIERIELTFEENNLKLTLDCSYGTQEINCGNGFFMHNQPVLKNLNPAIWTNHIKKTPIKASVFASYTISGNEVAVTLRHKDTPHVQIWHLPIDDNGVWSITMRTGTLNEQIRSTKLSLVQ